MKPGSAHIWSSQSVVAAPPWGPCHGTLLGLRETLRLEVALSPERALDGEAQKR